MLFAQGYKGMDSSVSFLTRCKAGSQSCFTKDIDEGFDRAHADPSLTVNYLHINRIPPDL